MNIWRWGGVKVIYRWHFNDLWLPLHTINKYMYFSISVEWMLKVSLFPAYAPSYACQPDLSSNIAHIQYVCITCTIRRTVIIHMYCTLCIMYTYYRSYLHILYSTLHNATAGQSGYQSAWTRQWPKCIRWHVKIPKTGWMKGDAEKQFSEIPDIYSCFSEHDTFISQLF